MDLKAKSPKIPFLLSLALLLMVQQAFSDSYKYNPHSKTYEYVPENYVLRYNPHSKEYSFVAPEEELKYNPHKKQFSFAKPESKLKYNPHTKEYILSLIHI